MSNERKEGVVLAAVVLCFLLVLALLADWRHGIRYGFFEIEGFDGLEYHCDGVGRFASCESIFGFEGFQIKYTSVLIWVIPFLFYGALRSFGIVRRLFLFEKKLSKLLYSENEDQKTET